MRAVVVPAVIVAALVAACPPSGAPVAAPPGPPPPPSYQPGAAIGAPCDGNADCASGLCEGEGCGPGQGVCADPKRMCTMDVTSYCGCDGQTFEASGSCPGHRYAARGACAPAAAADGAACATGTDCASGLCEGQGCGDDAGGVCVSAERACTMDLRSYCGCDGQTFRASGTCPNRRFAARGDCLPATARAAGAPCQDGGQCASGVCEGQGCGDDALGTCAPATRGCTRDLRSYCGCDGQTFRAS
ncbi:MAG: hypothetical protein R3B06_29945, partial [Kofleriaceae bacterium]